jgi:hypothetical protein
VVPPADRETIARLIATGDRPQLADPRYRRELAAWGHPNRGGDEDGMRGRAVLGRPA